MAEYSTDEKTIAQVLIGGDVEALPKDATTSGTFYKKVREMRNQPTVRLARFLSAAPILAAPWSIEETDEAPEEAREFIDRELMPIKSHILGTSVYGCNDFGWQPYEKVYVLRPDGKIGIKKIKPLLQDKTEIEIDPANGSFDGFKQDELKIELQDALLVSQEVEGTNWYGNGAMSSVSPVYDDWKRTNLANAKYDKKIAGAHWIIQYPPGKSMLNGIETDNDTIAKTLLINLEESGSFVVPRTIENHIDDLNKDAEAWKIDIKSAYPTSGVAFLDRMKYLDALFTRCFGLPERAVLEGTFGTKAEAEAHADFAIVHMDNRHQDFVRFYNWHIVNQLLRINYGEQFENTVRLVAAPITDVHLQFYRKLYMEYFTNPEGFAQEFSNVDMKSLREKLAIPEATIADQAATDTAEANAALQTVAASLLRLSL